MKPVIPLLLFSIWAGLGASHARAKDAEAGEPWWKHAVIYEVYPRSFQDSNGDGIGDLNGITQRLDYLESLGVDAIWIAPMYPSPQVDFGYDISNYEAVDPQYGTLGDFDHLVAAARKHRIRIILDMVLNHTSSQHPWFKAATRSRADPKHDWYIWNDGRPGPNGTVLPPNNWISVFGGSGWQANPATGDLYYHRFYRDQPDLNWRNPAVEEAMFKAMQFWLDRGVAGFRLDAITALFEDPQLRDEPAAGGKTSLGDPNLKHVYTTNLPEVHQVLRRMRKMVDRYDGERVLIGETYVPDAAELDKWYGGERKDELQLPMDMPVGFLNKLSAARFRERIMAAETQIHGSQPLFVFDNHDQIRSWDRYGDGIHDLSIAKAIATLLLTSKATALLYQGEEIGQRTEPPLRREDVKDPIGLLGWPKDKGRDGVRRPMPWSGREPQGGFSANPQTWIPIDNLYQSVNVSQELAQPASLLSWYRQLIALRRSNPALRTGQMDFVDNQNLDVLSYLRISTDGATVLICLNLSSERHVATLDSVRLESAIPKWETLMTTDSTVGQVVDGRTISLNPYCCWIGKLRP